MCLFASVMALSFHRRFDFRIEGFDIGQNLSQFLGTDVMFTFSLIPSWFDYLSEAEMLGSSSVIYSTPWIYATKASKYILTPVLLLIRRARPGQEKHDESDKLKRYLLLSMNFAHITMYPFNANPGLQSAHSTLPKNPP